MELTQEYFECIKCGKSLLGKDSKGKTVVNGVKPPNNFFMYCHDHVPPTPSFVIIDEVVEDFNIKKFKKLIDLNNLRLD